MRALSYPNGPHGSDEIYGLDTEYQEELKTQLAPGAKAASDTEFMTNMRPDLGLDLLCTASTAGRKLLQWLHPSTAIIEEASQVTELTMINGIALKLGFIKKIMLSGDIDQLGPTVPFVNDNEFYDSKNMSLFARLLHLGVPNAQLSQQYRMTPQVAELPNAEFYNGRLVTASTADTPCRGLQMATSQRYGVQRDDCFMSVMNSNLWSR
ncbi:hypothetical protein BDV33DRAFT_209471 [Aspergillus novoparasiticus]|uniref:AAA domain-containing protein n=1 Tax=Aspergillus novoparasiticus TaxID=986946 RepID=A0A5N6EA50_9EURO|nr:hypothetical protein BDV33DRAFT_209471 [Aspergillus novoparasiticus]